MRGPIRQRRPAPHSLYKYDTYFAVHSPGMSELIVAVDVRDLDALCLKTELVHARHCGGSARGMTTRAIAYGRYSPGHHADGAKR